jgi:nucleotide-binding universal stress UspA family protein
MGVPSDLSPTIRKILLPVDDYDSAVAFLPQLRPLLLGDVEVVVLHAYDHDSREDATAAVSVARKLCHDGHNAWARTVVAKPAAAIVEAAQDERVSLIAMATHGRSGPARWVVGSVTEEILRHTNVPMFVARLGTSVAEAPVREHFRHILVPVDGSESSLAVIPWVAAVARRHEAEITVVHYVSDYMGKEGMRGAQAVLETARRAFALLKLSVHTEVQRGDAGDGITDYGLFEERHGETVDLVALATHGRTGVARALLGSIAEQVMRNTLVPTLLVRGG